MGLLFGICLESKRKKCLKFLRGSQFRLRRRTQFRLRTSSLFRDFDETLNGNRVDSQIEKFTILLGYEKWFNYENSLKF